MADSDNYDEPEPVDCDKCRKKATELAYKVRRCRVTNLDLCNDCWSKARPPRSKFPRM